MNDKTTAERRAVPGEHPMNMETFNSIQTAHNFMDDLLQDHRDFAVSTSKFGHVTVSYPGPRLA